MSEHDKLVRRAGQWLRSIGCSVVLEELVAYTRSGETPDAIGWCGHRCVMVECKTSRSDFLADRKKRARHSGRALGGWRFYLTAFYTIKPDELPEGWGLYEIRGRSVVHTGGEKWANASRPPLESDKDSEIAMLLSALRRLEIASTVFVRPDVEAPHE